MRPPGREREDAAVPRPPVPLRPALLAFLTALAAGGLASPAVAETRTATLDDPPDPTVLFDIEQVRAGFDADAGRLVVTVRLTRPLPDPAAGGIDAAGSASVWVGVNPDAADRCAVPGTPAAGDTYVSFAHSASPRPRYTATHRVSFRSAYTTVDAFPSADRRELSVVISDPPLLAGADLTCLSASGSGRAAEDPTRPGGGPTYDATDGRFFDGFAPLPPEEPFEDLGPYAEPLPDPEPPPEPWVEAPPPPRLTVSYRVRGPQRLRPTGSGPAANLRGTSTCSVDCAIAARGHATTPAGRRLPGLAVARVDLVPAGRRDAVGFDLSGRERRTLRGAFRRFGRVRWVITLSATDALGRRARVTRRVTLLPSAPPAPRRPPARPR